MWTLWTLTIRFVELSLDYLTTKITLGSKISVCIIFSFSAFLVVFYLVLNFFSWKASTIGWYWHWQTNPFFILYLFICMFLFVSRSSSHIEVTVRNLRLNYLIPSTNCNIIPSMIMKFCCFISGHVWCCWWSKQADKGTKRDGFVSTDVPWSVWEI